MFNNVNVSFYLTLLLVGVCKVCFGIWQLMATLRRVETTSTMYTRTNKNCERVSTRSTRKQRCEYTIQFKDPYGHHHSKTLRLRQGRTEPPGSILQPTQLTYDPEDPVESLRIGKKQPMLILSSLFIALGSVLILVGMTLVVRHFFFQTSPIHGTPQRQDPLQTVPK